MRDLHSHISAALVSVAALSADNTPAAIDLQGFNSVDILLAVGVGGITFSGSNKIEFKLTHSDDDSNYAPVTIADVRGVQSVGDGGIIKALVAAHADAAVYRIGYKGGRRYLRLLIDFSGTHGSPTPIAAIVLKGNPASGPTDNQA